MFGDSSVISNYTIVYAMVYQLHSINPDFIVSKFGIFNSNLTIPSSELVLAHISASLVANTKNGNENQNLKKVEESVIVFSICFFFHKRSWITGQQGGGEGYFFNSSLPLPPISQTFRH